MPDDPCMAGHDVFLVFVEGHEGRQDEYARWFAGTHMADMLRLPGVISASAFGLESIIGRSESMAPACHPAFAPDRGECRAREEGTQERISPLG